MKLKVMNDFLLVEDTKDKSASSLVPTIVLAQNIGIVAFSDPNLGLNPGDKVVFGPAFQILTLEDKKFKVMSKDNLIAKFEV